MKAIAEEAHPITGRGIGYKLFAAGLIDGMDKMNVVYRALKVAREDGDIPWDWIVDETRELELISTWKNPSGCADGFFYRRDLWQTQPHTVEVWSEKGTVRGVLWPVLSRLGVGFRVLHGFTSATSVWEVSNRGNDDRALVALYIGDWDPSGMCMSEHDLPQRIKEYGGDHIELRRIALTAAHTASLPSFSVESKARDTRYKWFKQLTVIDAGNWTRWTRVSFAQSLRLRSLRSLTAPSGTNRRHLRHARDNQSSLRFGYGRTSKAWG
jgi:hypothetical protein